MTDRKLVIITDAGQDGDDELALLLICSFIKKGICPKPSLIIVNYGNFATLKHRAELVDKLFELCGEKLDNKTIVFGTTALKTDHTKDFWSNEYPSESSYFGGKNDDDIKYDINYDGQYRLKMLYNDSGDNEIDLLCISGFTDISFFAYKNKEIFKKKTSRIILMSGSLVGKKDSLILDESDIQKLHERNTDLENEFVVYPSKTANNNTFDLSATNILFDICRGSNISTCIYSKYDVLPYAFPSDIYKYKGDDGVFKVFSRLDKTQEEDIISLLVKWSSTDDNFRNKERVPKDLVLESWTGRFSKYYNDILKQGNKKQILEEIESFKNEKDNQQKLKKRDEIYSKVDKITLADACTAVLLNENYSKYFDPLKIGNFVLYGYNVNKMENNNLTTLGITTVKDGITKSQEDIEIQRDLLISGKIKTSFKTVVVNEKDISPGTYSEEFIEQVKEDLKELILNPRSQIKLEEP